MKKILLAGMPGAGKEEFLRVAQNLDYEIVRMGDVVREMAEKQDIPLNDVNIGSFAHEERETHHYGIWADRTMSKLSEEKTVIDGIRSAEEVLIFKAELGDKLTVVAIHASPEARFKRLKDRDREDAPEAWEEFTERDERELDWGLGRVISKAEVMIINECPLSEYHKKVKELLR